MGEAGQQDVIHSLGAVLPRPSLDLPLGAAEPDQALTSHDFFVVVFPVPLALQRPGVLQGVVPVGGIAVAQSFNEFLSGGGQNGKSYLHPAIY